MRVKDSQTIPLFVEKPSNVLPFVKYATAPEKSCNGTYTKNVEHLEFVWGPHNWMLLRIILAYTPYGWFWGTWSTLKGLDYHVPCNAYHHKPVKTRARALGDCRYALIQRFNTTFASFPLLRDEPSNKAALAWLKALEVAS